MRTVIFVAALFTATACTPPAALQTPPPTPSSTTSPSPPSSSSALPSPTAIASTSFADAPESAQWAVTLYTVTNDGIAHRMSQGSTTDLGRACDGSARSVLARADGRALLVRCSGPSDEDVLAIFDLASGRATKLATRSISSFSLAWSPDGQSVAYFELGDCPMPAPVCQTRGVIFDVRAGTKREMLASAYHLGTELRWDDAGLRMFQPECAEAGCFPPERVGTFKWDGTRFVKSSDLRLVASDTRFSLYERTRSLSDRSAVRNVVLRDGQTERTLTTVGPREFAIDLLPRGHSIVFAETGPGELDGALREYDAEGRTLWSRGARAYPPWTTHIGDVVVTGLYEGTPSMSVNIYDPVRGLRFVVPLSTSAFVAVGP